MGYCFQLSVRGCTISRYFHLHLSLLLHQEIAIRSNEPILVWKYFFPHTSQCHSVTSVALSSYYTINTNQSISRNSPIKHTNAKNKWAMQENFQEIYHALYLQQCPLEIHDGSNDLWKCIYKCCKAPTAKVDAIGQREHNWTKVDTLGQKWPKFVPPVSEISIAYRFHYLSLSELTHISGRPCSFWCQWDGVWF